MKVHVEWAPRVADQEADALGEVGLKEKVRQLIVSPRFSQAHAISDHGDHLHDFPTRLRKTIVLVSLQVVSLGRFTSRCSSSR